MGPSKGNFFLHFPKTCEGFHSFILYHLKLSWSLLSSQCVKLVSDDQSGALKVALRKVTWPSKTPGPRIFEGNGGSHDPTWRHFESSTLIVWYGLKKINQDSQKICETFFFLFISFFLSVKFLRQVYCSLPEVSSLPPLLIWEFLLESIIKIPVTLKPLFSCQSVCAWLLRSSCNQEQKQNTTTK